MPFVSRAGQKLDYALTAFNLDVADLVAADFGCSTGGFVDCLLQRGAKKVYAIDTGYGVLEYKLRIDPRVVVMERTNAMHVELPEKVDLVCIDVAWTRQKHILPRARTCLKPAGLIVSLIKPHYEADPKDLRKGILRDEQIDLVLQQVKRDIAAGGFAERGIVASPILGGKGNREFLALLHVDSNSTSAP